MSCGVQNGRTVTVLLAERLHDQLIEHTWWERLLPEIAILGIQDRYDLSALFHHIIRPGVRRLVVLRVIDVDQHIFYLELGLHGVVLQAFAQKAREQLLTKLVHVKEGTWETLFGILLIETRPVGGKQQLDQGDGR